MVFGREVELGFANFKEKENPFTSITRFGSSPIFGGSSNNPPANTTGNVAGIPSGLFGMPTTANSLPTTSSSPVATESPPDLCFGPCRDTHPPMPLFSSCQNSTSAFLQPSNPFSVSQTTGGQQSSGGSLFGIPFPSSSSTKRFGFSTASPTGDKLCATNPITASAALSSQSTSCSFQQPSNSAPSSTLFSSVPLPPLFSTPKCSQSGGQHSSGWTPCSSGGLHLAGRCPFSSCISSSSAVSQSGGQRSSGSSLFSSSICSLSDGLHPSGWSPFSSTSPFSVQLSSSCSSATTSPVGSELSFRGFFNPSGDSGVGGSTISSTGPFTKSFVQHNNTSSNSPSVFAPFTRSNLRTSDIQGTRICSYAPTSYVENNVNGELTSISAIPLYKEKSHEELRLEDYRLSSLIQTSGSSYTGAIPSFSISNTSSSGSLPLGPSVSTTFTSRIETSSLPVSNLGISDVQGTRICSYAPTSLVEYGYGELNSISAMPCYERKSHEELRLEDYRLPNLIPTSSSSTTGAIPSFSISNKLSTDSQLLGPSVSTTCTSPIETPLLPLQRPVTSVPLSIEIRHLGDLLATAQITIPVPSSAAVSASNSATVTESIITSIPEPVSTGGFHWPAHNRQTPLKPVTEARITLRTTETHGISGLPDSENGESSPPTEKYKPDDEDAVKYRKILDVMAMVPKLKCPNYYTVPSLDDLITNELKRPGFCSQVKDFEIGKRGYGSIKFLGETDVRNLDLESMVRFNTREVIFWMEKAKPPIGQGLNKAAEITLNVHCIDKTTGKQYIDGPKVDKYKQLLVRKTMEQGAEFVSFDPVKGEWKFKVQHF